MSIRTDTKMVAVIDDPANASAILHIDDLEDNCEICIATVRMDETQARDLAAELIASADLLRGQQ